MALRSWGYAENDGELQYHFLKTTAAAAACPITVAMPAPAIPISGRPHQPNISIRPTVRGSVMNPCDHPHGGGEGKSPVGRPGPVTPWGKPALGYKTRKTKNRTDKFIVKRRNAK